jgi:hypothetical protein
MMQRRIFLWMVAVSILLFSNFTTLAQHKAFIIDDRLAALRRTPDMKAEVVRRLRIGRAVYLIETKAARGKQPKFYRVAVTRRTRGWLHVGAVIIPGRAGEAERVMKLIETTASFDRLTLCKFFIEQFKRSPLMPRVLLAIAEQAEQAASSLNRSADRRLKNLAPDATPAQLRDYYLSDTGLDRYSRLQIHFDFVENHSEYVYDGQAYREIIKRFPKSAEAVVAKKQLEMTQQRLAQK